MEKAFGRLICFLVSGLLFLLIINNVGSIADTGHQDGPINMIDGTLKGTMKEKAMSLSSNYFIQNMGQIDSDEIQFYSREGNIFFTPDGVLYRFSETEPIDEYGSDPDPINEHMKRSQTIYHEWGVVLKYSFTGSKNVIPEGRDRCAWNTNYFKGNDPARWYTDVPNYEEIVYPELWDGVDIVYRLKDGSIKYDLILHPGADPPNIRIRIDGANDLTMNEEGDLVIGTEYWDILDSGLVSNYGDGSNEPISCRFELMNDREYGIGLGSYDRSRDVVIDPLIDYSTYIGGSGNDWGYDIEIDTSGNAYITGVTNDHTTNYPTTSGAYDTTHNGWSDVFVTKLNSAGSSLMYSTFIGGTSLEYGCGIAIDTKGNAYITGNTGSGLNFPTTTGAYDTTHNGAYDVFVTKLNPTGSSLVYSTFIGGLGGDYGEDISIDTSGNAYITGSTGNGTTVYPTTLGAYDRTYNGGDGDVFVTKLNPTGSSLVYSTFIGGSGGEVGYSITIDTKGNTYITGYTNDDATDYPTTSGAFDTTHNGEFDVFVTKLNPMGSSLVYSTFIGGSGGEVGYSITIDTKGNVYITGWTHFGQPDYPTTSGAFDTTHNGVMDVFVTELNPTGSLLVYSTFIGGTIDDFGYSIAIDTKGNAYITGWTVYTGSSYPTTLGAYDRTYNGGYGDVFVTNLTVKDVNLPEFGSDNSTLSATTGDQFAFSIEVTDNVGVDSVFVEFWFGNSTHINVSMMGAGPYEYHISIPADSTAPLSYIFRANDTANNWNQKKKRVVDVLDNDRPIFGTDSTPTNGTTGDQFTFSIQVTDNMGVSGVFVEYWFGYGSGTSTNHSLLGFKPYTYSIYIPTNSTRPLNYIFHANDSAGNWVKKSKRVVDILDNDRPVFGNDTTPITGTTGDQFTFSIQVTDNIGVSGVFVEYWYGNDPTPSTNLSMWGFGPYKYSIHIPADSMEPLSYIFRAEDKDHNWNQKSKRVVKLLDNDGPIFVNDSTPNSVAAGDQITFSIEVTDNIAISTVWLEYWFGDGVHKKNNMTGNGVYIYLLTIPMNSTDSLHYIIHANDTSNNWNEFIGADVSIRDNNPPYFGALSIPVSIGTGEILNCQIEVFDDIGISAVYFEYWYGFRPHFNVTMTRTGSYSIDLEIPKNSIIPLNFIISAVDGGGNWISISDDVDVIDVIVPISRPGPDLTSNEDSPAFLNGSLSSDNIGIVNWTWKFSDGDADVFLYGMETSFIFDQPGKYRVFLNVSDTAGNWQETSFNVTVNDVTDPIIVLSTLECDENEVATFDGSRCSDNVGIVNWTWTFDDRGETKTLFGEITSYAFSKQGKYTINLTVRDEAGNSATDTMMVNVHDADDLGKFIRDHWWIAPILFFILILVIFLVLRKKNIAESSEAIEPATTKPSPAVSTEE